MNLKKKKEKREKKQHLLEDNYLGNTLIYFGNIIDLYIDVIYALLMSTPVGDRAVNERYRTTSHHINTRRP